MAHTSQRHCWRLFGKQKRRTLQQPTYEGQICQPNETWRGNGNITMGFSGAAALRIFQCICNVQIFLIRRQLQVVGALKTEQCQTRSVKHDKGSRTMRRAGEAFSQPVASRIYSLAWEFFRFLGSQIKLLYFE